MFKRQGMTKKRNGIPLAGILLLASSLLVPAAPAEASEVVKLVRLVITGKRISNAPVKPVKKAQVPQRADETEARVAEAQRSAFRPI